ncbi:MAG TPA: hypothetical protein VFI06_14920, partial [Chitinophagaceae bacterium]|nr:hypothetical protein [Chitinophagaceae bacterium]
MKKIVFPGILFFALAVHAGAGNFVVKNGQVETPDTLNILISAANHVYYYTSPMAEDASNFKAIGANNIHAILLF